jgi:hypothetical protein
MKLRLRRPRKVRTQQAKPSSLLTCTQPATPIDLRSSENERDREFPTRKPSGTAFVAVVRRRNQVGGLSAIGFACLDVGIRRKGSDGGALLQGLFREQISTLDGKRTEMLLYAANVVLKSGVLMGASKWLRIWRSEAAVT